MAGALRFILVGAVNTLVGYLAFGFFTYVGQPDSVSVLMANLLGLFFNFATYGNAVFRSFRWNRLPRFALVYGLNYGGNVAGLGMLRSHGVSPYLAQLAILPFSAVFLYFALRYFVFGRLDEAH